MKKALIILSVLFLILSLYFLRHYLSIFYFQNDINKIAINIETTSSIGDIYVCFNKNCDKSDYKNNIYFYKLNQQNPLFYDDISKINLIVKDKNNIDKIENISVFSGNKFNYYNINSLEKEDIIFEGKSNCSIDIPYLTNSKSIIQKISIYFESLFYNWYFYIISYILIIFSLIKYNYKINFNNKMALFLIILLGGFLRLSHIDFIPLWNDELYTYTVISDSASGFNFKNIFIDPGNPPLFFLLSNIWLKYFNSSVLLIRLLPFLIGLFGIYFIYFVTDKILNKKTALTASFLSAINIFMILESNEIRSYILSMNLVLFGMFCFYELYKNKTNKNLFLYFVSSILLINTHFYCLLYSLFNFILGLKIFKEIRIKFLLSNLISFSTFFIYFLINYKISLSNTFNTWLEKPTIDVIYNHIVFYFGNFIFLILVVLFLIYIIKRISIKEKTIIAYMLSVISFVFTVSYIFSWIVKPILFERYFCIFLPFFIIITSIMLTYNYKTKFKPLILAVVFFLSVNMPKHENFNLFSNIYFMMKYSISDSIKYLENSNVYFVIPDNIKYKNYFKETKNLNNANFVVSNNGIKEDIDIIERYIKNSKKNKVIIYLPEICTNNLIRNKYSTKKIYTSILPIYKIIVLK